MADESKPLLYRLPRETYFPVQFMTSCIQIQKLILGAVTTQQLVCFMAKHKRIAKTYKHHSDSATRRHDDEEEGHEDHEGNINNIDNQSPNWYFLAEEEQPFSLDNMVDNLQQDTFSHAHRYTYTHRNHPYKQYEAEDEDEDQESAEQEEPEEVSGAYEPYEGSEYDFSSSYCYQVGIDLEKVNATYRQLMCQGDADEGRESSEGNEGCNEGSEGRLRFCSQIRVKFFDLQRPVVEIGQIEECLLPAFQQYQETEDDLEPAIY